MISSVDGAGTPEIEVTVGNMGLGTVALLTPPALMETLVVNTGNGYGTAQILDPLSATTVWVVAPGGIGPGGYGPADHTIVEPGTITIPNPTPTVPAPGALLLALSGTSLATWLRRRKTL